MKTIELPPPPAPAAPAPAVARQPDPVFDSGSVHAFEQVMSGFVAAAPAAPGPSLMSQMVRVPAQAYADGMAHIQTPRPDGMSVSDSLEFYAMKQIELNELKIVNNMSTTVVRMFRKGVETVLNNK